MLSRSRRRALVAVFAVGGFVLGQATPAIADEVSGSGSGQGWEIPQWDENTYPINCEGQPPFFGTVTGDRFELEHTGTYTGVDDLNNTVAVYLGGTTVEITVGEHVISPAGTYTSCAALEASSVPSEVAITSVAIEGTAATGDVDCSFGSSGSGTYLRVQSAVVFDFVVECEVDGNQLLLSGSVEADAHHVIEGTMVPCVDPFTMTENPACSSNSEAGSVLVTTYEAETVT